MGERKPIGTDPAEPDQQIFQRRHGFFSEPRQSTGLDQFADQGLIEPGQKHKC